MLCGSDAYVDDEFHVFVGAGVEIKLSRRFSAETEAIFRPVKYQSQVVDFYPPTISLALPFGSHGKTITQTWSTEGHAWDFPILFKAALTGSANLQPYLNGGFVASHTNRTTSVVVVDSVLGTLAQNNGRSVSLTRAGIIFGGGVRLKFGRFAILPEGRFTEWLSDEMPGEVSSHRGVEFLVGIAFGGK